MRKVLPFVLIGAFFALLIPRMTQSIAQGDVYPEWSTMRSDPMGVKVLFLALQRMGGAVVERNYEPWQEMRSRRAEYVFMGVSPLMMQDVKALEKLVAEDGLALLALRPATAKAGSRTEKLGFLQFPKAGLELRSDDWRCLSGERKECVLAERKTGKGRVWLLADGSVLRNGELHEKRNTDLLAQLFSNGLPVVFDESHLGVNETGGVGVLLKRYRLFPAIGLMLAGALLFVWRNSTSLLPEREPVSAAMAPQPAASLRTLLAQRVPRAKLLETLVGEWKRALPLLPVWHRGRAEEMEAVLGRVRSLKDVKQGYAELQAAIKLRKGSA
ncbi:MAG: hypothetical protein HYX27_02480 [Acidobacteria bacterium]|nr:hypothetical protein [Acidobacteriota bacterium]